LDEEQIMFTVTVGYKNEQIENEPFEDEDDALNNL